MDRFPGIEYMPILALKFGCGRDMKVVREIIIM
jgi:hypothetical protein